MNLDTQSAFDCHAFLQEARVSGILLNANQDRIDIWGPKDALTLGFTNLLRENKSAILDYLSARGSLPEPPAHQPVLRVDPHGALEPFPLSDIQRAYWVGRQQAFDLGEVSIHFYTELDCRMLDVPRLELAWNRVVAHHGMLRALVDDQGVQRVLGQVPNYRIEVTDLRKARPEVQAEALAAKRAELSHKVHGSDMWPGFDLQVALIDDETSRIFFGQDLLHIDGGSLLLLFEDLNAWYAEPSRSKPLPGLSYRDYVLTELALKETPAYQNDLAYWREQVKSLPPPPELPRRDAKGARPCFERRTFDIDAAQFARLRSQAAKLGFTPTSYVLTAFSDIVRTWNGGHAYTLNVTLFNRPEIHPDIHRIAGDFTSMVLVPIRQDEGETLGSRALRLQRMLWRHLDHRRVSGITILDELRKAAGSQDAAKLSVVFTSLLNLAGQGFSPQWLTGLGQAVYTVTQTPQVTLDHQVFDNADGGLTFSWDVIESWFPEGLVDAMFGAYKDLIQALLADDAQWEAVSPCHTPAHQLAMFKAVNDTAQAFPQEDTLRSLFKSAAQANAQSTAVVHGRMALRYATVARAADQLGALLQREGVTSGDRVMVFMDKSWVQPVAVLGVHAAGAAYVPVDTSSPEMRLAHILADSAVAVVLLDEHSQALWPKHLQAKTLVIGTEILHAYPEPMPRVVVTHPEDVSHIIYTSGSTGTPKGVVIEHRQVVNRILDINQRFSIGPGDAMLGITALHHDLSVYDVFGILASGGTLVLPEAEQRLDPAHWLDLMVRHEVTLWNSVPAFASMLVDHLDDAPASQALPPLRWMILAGDWIPVSLPDRLHARWPELDFIASGGPTETTIWDIWNRVAQTDPSWTSIPYGQPLANAQYHVLDPQGQPCPVWVKGELTIGGAGVTRGYLNAPEITAAKYLTMPGSDQRLFRSGDMGRYLPDGNIEFMGRNDFQVKVNGQRIELNEIERVALTHAPVQQAVALVHHAERGPQLRLFVATGQAAVDADAQDAIDAQEAEFTALEVAVKNPMERLLQKLEYRALTPPENARLLALPKTDWPVDLPQSHRMFDRAELPVEALSRFLAPLRGMRNSVSGEAKFAYGSAGGLYPVQIYLYFKSGAFQGLEEGVYRFYPLDDAIELVSPGALPRQIHWSHNLRMVDAAAWMVFLVGELQVIRGQYGAMAEPMAYLEAGMMSQALRAAALHSGFGVCQIGDLAFGDIAARFGLTADHTFLTSLVAGQLPANRAGDVPRKVDLADTLREHLSMHLPPHMVPPAIVSMPALPLTANGKIDRMALMTMQIDKVCEPRAHVVPEQGFEASVAQILTRLLGVTQVSATDNFFDIGANSALLARAYPVIQRETGAAFPLISLFRFPTIRSLSDSLSSHPARAEGQASGRRASRQKKALNGLRKTLNT